MQKVEKTEGNEKSPRKRRVVFNKVKQADYTQAAIAGSALPDTASRRSWMGAVIAAPIPSYVIYLRAHYIVCDKTEISETDLISSASAGWDERGMEEREAYRDFFLESCSFEVLKADRPYDRDLLDEILEMLVEVCSSTQRTMRISGDEKPIQAVKSRLMKLEQEHIQYVLDCFQENTMKVRNIKQYLLASLYNAPMTIGSYYTALVNRDMYGSVE